MDILKKLFPLSWKYANDVANVVVGVILYVVAGITAGAVIWLAGAITGWIPLLGALVGWVLGIIGSLFEVYVIAGIVVLILVYLKVIKD
jgi:hypothetical protein